MKLKYYIYCRRSQDREDKQVLSIESQKRELLAFARERNFDVVEIIDEEQTAYKRGRPKFAYMMDGIEAGKANAVLSWHLTRLARNSADGGLIITFMDEGKIAELRTPEKTYTNCADDKFMMNIHFAMAKKSSDDTSSFVKNNLKTKLEKGEYPGIVPYGYLNIDKNGVISGKRFDRDKQALLENLGRPLGRVEIDPIEGPLIRKLIDLALTGAYNLAMLQEEAFKLGIKGKRSGKMVCKETIRGILTNIFYKGEFYYLYELHNGSHEPLMTEPEFDKLQFILSQRSRPKSSKRHYSFSGLVYCPQCDKSMSGDFQKGANYYRCSRAKGKRATCSNTAHIREDVLEDELQQSLSEINMPSHIFDWAMKYLQKAYLEENKTLSSKRSLLQKNINSERTKLERLTAKWLSDANVDGGLMSDSDYVLQKESIQKNIACFEEQLGDNNNEEDSWLAKCEEFFVKIRDIAKVYSCSDPIEKKIVLQSVGAKFIRKGEKMTVQLEEPFSFILNERRAQKVSEPQLLRSVKDKMEGLTPEMLNWLPRLDSNQ